MLIANSLDDCAKNITVGEFAAAGFDPVAEAAAQS